MSTLIRQTGHRVTRFLKRITKTRNSRPHWYEAEGSCRGM